MVAEHGPANALDEGRVSPNEQFESGFVVCRDEPGQQFGIGGAGRVATGSDTEVVADGGLAHGLACGDKTVVPFE